MDLQQFDGRWCITDMLYPNSKQLTQVLQQAGYLQYLQAYYDYSSMNVPTIPTLYAWAGENNRLEQLTEVFYGKVRQDEVLGSVFLHMSPDHARHVAHFIGEVFGGPPLYTTSDGGSHAQMVAHHVGKHLTETQRRRWLALLLDSADDVGLPDDPEFRSALVGYLEWGSRLAVLNSNAAENPVQADAPMPIWGWGETGGPYVPEHQ